MQRDILLVILYRSLVQHLSIISLTFILVATAGNVFLNATVKVIQLFLKRYVASFK